MNSRRVSYREHLHQIQNCCSANKSRNTALACNLRKVSNTSVWSAITPLPEQTLRFLKNSQEQSSYEPLVLYDSSLVRSLFFSPRIWIRCQCSVPLLLVMFPYLTSLSVYPNIFEDNNFPKLVQLKKIYKLFFLKK